MRSQLTGKMKICAFRVVLTSETIWLHGCLTVVHSKASAQKNAPSPYVAVLIALGILSVTCPRRAVDSNVPQQPVYLAKYRCHMDAVSNAGDKPCGGVLHSLESINFVLKETVKQAASREVTKEWTKISDDALSTQILNLPMLYKSKGSTSASALYPLFD